MMKSGLEKIFFWNSLTFALMNYKNTFYFIDRRIFAKITNSVAKITLFPHDGISKKSVCYIFLQENFEGIHQLQVIHQDLGLTPYQGINPLWYPHIQKTPLNIQMIPHPLIQDPLYPQKTMILHEFFRELQTLISILNS